MQQPDPPWGRHPDPAVEALFARADPGALLARLGDASLRNDPYAHLRLLDCLRAAGSTDPRLTGAWLQAMLLANRPLRAWRVTGNWPVDARTPAEAQLLAAQVARAVGRTTEARERFQDLLRRHPFWVDALQKYVEFERAAMVPVEVRHALERILATGATDYDHEKAGFALSRVVLTDDPQRAFTLATTAQAMKRRRLGPWNHADLARRLSEDLPLRAPPPCDRPAREVFIVGLPRSGTTLLASLLGAHPSIANIGEQGLVPAAAGRRFDSVDDACSAVRDWYRAAVSDLAGGAPVVVDKLPANAEYAGFILAHFPDALVVHLERDPDDCATSIHLHDFESGNTYACDGNDLGRYAAAIGSHLRQLRERNPERVLHLGFEDLAHDPEATLTPLLRRLHLEWHPSIPGFWRHDVQTATYSENQVREPVHTRSIGSARRFLPASAGFLDAVRDGAGQ